MLAALLAVLLDGSRTDMRIHDTVARIELNHVHDERGKLVYSQFIFSDFGPHGFECLAWTMTQPHSDAILTRSFAPERYEVTWYDKEARTTRRIVSGVFLETWTRTDRERENQKVFPMWSRRGLSGPYRCLR